MSANIIPFLEKLYSPDLLWSSYSTARGGVCTAIEPKHLLLLEVRLFHPDKNPRYIENPHKTLRWRSHFEGFDPSVHYHWYEIRVNDPAFRWGKKKIISLYSNPDGPNYDFLKSTYERIIGLSRVVGLEKIFSADQEVSTVAVEALIGQST